MHVMHSLSAGVVPGANKLPGLPQLGAGAGFQSPQAGSDLAVPVTWAKAVTVSAASVRFGKQD